MHGSTTMNRFIEQRTVQRRKVKKHATIEVLGRPALGCVLADLSPIGATVELVDTAFLPTKLHLRLPGATSPVDCEVIQRNGRRIGLSFHFPAGPIGLAARRAIRNALAELATISDRKTVFSA